MLMGFSVFSILVCYIMDSLTKLLTNSGLYDIVLGIFAGLAFTIYIITTWLSSSRKVFYLLIQERRVIFILIVLGILFYIDNIFGNWSAAGIAYPVGILCYISYDMIVKYYPRRVAFGVMTGITLITLWCIFNHTFLIADCEQRKLAWGIFGEKISYCTIKRLIYQTILSLTFSAAISVFRNGTNTLFFCNANIYRSTGTINQHTMDEVYVSSMKMEKDRAIAADKSNVEVEIT
jgi:hypothetical protein